MKKVVSIFFVLAMSFIMIKPVFARNTEIDRMIIDVYLDRQGNAYVKETWNMYVDEGSEIYKVLDHMEESYVKNLSVTDDKGYVYQYNDDWDIDLDKEEKDGKCGIIKDGDRYEICFGIGDYGQRTYSFEYQITHFIKQYDQVQGLNYAFFSDMDLNINYAKVTLSNEEAFNEENSQIWAFGYQGKVYYQDGCVVLESDGSIAQDGQMQLLMKINDGMFQGAFKQQGDFQKILERALKNSEYDEQSYDQGDYYKAYEYDDSVNGYLIGGVAMIILLSSGLTISYGVKSSSMKKKRYEDDEELDLLSVQPSSLIPCFGDLFEIYFLAKEAHLIDEENKGGLISALLLKWIKEGTLTFERRENKGFFKWNNEKYEIDFHSTMMSSNELEVRLYHFMKEASGKNMILEDHEFEMWCSSHYEQLQQWFQDVETSIKNKYYKEGLIREEEVTDRWLIQTLHRKREVWSHIIKDQIRSVVALQLFLKTCFDELDEKQWEDYYIYVSLLDTCDELKETVNMDIYPMFYTMYTLHHMAIDSYHSSMNSSSSVSGGGGFSGGGGGGVR